MPLTREELKDLTQRRTLRILGYVAQPHPLCLSEIAAREGMTLCKVRKVIVELERDHGFRYLGTPAARGVANNDLAGLARPLRSRLADLLHKLTMQYESRELLAPVLGMNPREQLRAISKPYRHDWTLSQIERLALALGLESLPI